MQSLYIKPNINRDVCTSNCNTMLIFYCGQRNLTKEGVAIYSSVRGNVFHLPSQNIFTQEIKIRSFYMNRYFFFKMYQYFLLKYVGSEYILLSPLEIFFSINFNHRKKSHSPPPSKVKWSFPKCSNGCYSIKERNTF
jgi:hypothetical protein